MSQQFINPDVIVITPMATGSYSGHLEAWESEPKLDVQYLQVGATINFTSSPSSPWLNMNIDWIQASDSAPVPLMERLRNEIRSRFRAINEIAYIYENVPGKDYVIFLDHSHYDRELMYRLLDIEIDIREKFGNLEISMFYLPLFDREKGGVIHSNAKIILQH